MMPTDQDIFELLRSNRPRLATDYGLTKLGLFGSCAKGNTTSISDVDILVEFEKPLGLKFVEFAEELERLLHVRVDILTPEGLKGIRVRRVADDIATSTTYV